MKDKKLKITVASRILKDGRPMDAIATASPYLAIHANVDGFEDQFTITHIPTGYAVTQCCFSKRQAQLICAAAASMPYPWEKVTVKNATKLFKKLPECWQKWLKELRKAA